jgi:hypothetical protein
MTFGSRIVSAAPVIVRFTFRSALPHGGRTSPTSPHVASPARAEENAYLYRILTADPELSSIQSELGAAYAQALWLVGTRNLQAGSRRRAIRAATAAAKRGQYKAVLLIVAAMLPRRLLAAALPPPVASRH